MPAIITHYTCAKKALSRGKEYSDECFELGSQGPDPFFFYGQLPWKKRRDVKGVDSFGRDLHHIDVSDIYSKLIEYALKSSYKDSLISYIHGLFLHYSLDRSCHAYIFPRSGFALKKEDEKKYAALHCLFETYLDMEIGKNEDTFTYSCYKYLEVPSKELKEISRMWYEVNLQTLKNPAISPDSFYFGVKDYMSIEKFVNVNHSFKRWLLKKIMGENSLPFAMNFPSKIPAEHASLDFLNEKKTGWPDASTGKIHNESFMELFDKALEDYESLLPTLEEGEKGLPIVDKLHEFVDNRNHDGGQIGAKRTHMDSIWG